MAMPLCINLSASMPVISASAHAETVIICDGSENHSTEMTTFVHTRELRISSRNLMQYRADIDGLRAVAVLPVLFFHAGVPYFSGGFVGVDVFFVISGYVITKGIRAEIEFGHFSIAG
ncbi:acyltransferase [Bradyrhizobium sp. CB2312]|uniref:acyltransferase family protein n=1 Tax=Bradyrhizobium sp. CB2312 TaxID=3039155 RepID=UPI0024B11439|nr:acyltransferase [Bradyrhizobium sp. CB2312]WFU70962.1 acyltransferase [Bradyrhizobium sp. CB2312]